jgi:uncharacterized protein (TIGR02145 family)
MNKSNLLLFLYITIFQIGLTSYSQKVSNISFRQEQSNIIVSYDLETKTPCKVSLYVSTNGGEKWQGPLTKVTGDVGNKIVSGSHNITWNVLEEFEELKGDNIKFKIAANGENIETIKIGTQVWMAKNLDVSNYRNGDIIPEVKDAKEWSSLTTGAWCYYNNDTENEKIYGKLYNWHAVNDPRGLAPEGYHIPSLSEWSNLIDNLGGAQIAGGKMKETGNIHFAENLFASNSSGLSGLPGGIRYHNALFSGISYHCYWWTSSENKIPNAWLLTLSCNSGKADNYSYSKMAGISVRCIKD